MESFGYVVLRDEETGEIEKIGRFRDNGIAQIQSTHTRPFPNQ